LNRSNIRKQVNNTYTEKVVRWRKSNQVQINPTKTLAESNVLKKSKTIITEKTTTPKLFPFLTDRLYTDSLWIILKPLTFFFFFE
jgi:hypothetical protein